ncbi:TonB-dependent receptor [Sphingobium nicotianae]|uniref:TonB-dependent receptor n=1 Tax=Sphingobium nicotianae TaxID=2782607 RepID=A0A9X1DER2_9SPHN|nr:TonB-dependent receptor [Sphingobium nicotianae]MBT2188852.1 TonB-dependent receptor [Sphingobium nicotianae]
MNKFRIILAATVASGALTTGAFAQSTGSIDFEDAIIVTGSRGPADTAGIQVPDSTKAKGVITQELISRGGTNTILNTVNLIPGVSFQNNDPYGSAGGTLNIRGFGADRVSLTFDGMPLNDTGNYAVYSNQLLDSELIEQVNVNLGSTDVDSPTAAASGGTVNFRSRTPYDDFNVTMVGAIGDYNFYRMFGVIDTGVFTPWGTKAWFAASRTGNDNVYNNLGKIDKQQFNAKIYQPIGDNGDFISIAGHYNINRNNFFGSLPLRTDTDTGRVVGSDASNRYPLNADERFYNIAQCSISNVTPVAGTAQAASTCGTLFDYRYNPSNTGNIRIQSKFTLADGLVLTIDPSYQYVKANGGGTVSAREAYYDLDPTGGQAACTTVLTGAGISCQPGYFAGNPYFGRDLNGDGDLLDQVTVLAPSETKTNRYGVISSLRYDINEHHTIRAGYTLDYGRHRQTGEVGFLQPNGFGINPFPEDQPALDAKGAILQKRDRLSKAILHQVFGEYRGQFFDDRLTISAGLTGKFFIRDLTNNCWTSSAGGFVECFGTGGVGTFGTLRPTYAPPQNRVLHYNRVLPTAGWSFKITPAFSLFGNFSQGIQVPGTDPLYNSFFFPVGSPGSQPKPETTNSFDFGARYTTSKLQAQLTSWYTRYSNRLASAYDPDLNQTVYRNLGRVDKWGVDGSVGYQPLEFLTLYAFGSYLHSEIKDDIATFETTSGTLFYTPTAGKRESGAPVYTLGGRAEVHFEGLDVGLQGKRTGKRYVYDNNLPTFRRNANGTDTMIYGAVAPAYTLFDLDVRYSLKSFGAPNVWAQLNVSNLFDKFYVGGFGGGLTQTVNRNATTGAITGYGNPGFVQLGSPRAVMFSVHVQM